MTMIRKDKSFEFEKGSIFEEIANKIVKEKQNELYDPKITLEHFYFIWTKENIRGYSTQDTKDCLYWISSNINNGIRQLFKEEYLDEERLLNYIAYPHQFELDILLRGTELLLDCYIKECKVKLDKLTDKQIRALNHKFANYLMKKFNIEDN